MRLSCNGCRVLRKGCSENCSIRPCLEWFKNPEAQAHATLFLAKFYGRAGLINLIGAGPLHLRPAIFKSLLYEACGRIVNPIEGSTGLLCSGKWHLCEAAVEAVLTGSPITPTLPATTSQETAAGNDQLISNSLEPSKVCDIRHVCKQPSSIHQVSPNDVLHKSVKLGRKRRVKRCDQPKAVVKEMKLDKRSEIEADSGSSRDGSGVSQMRSRSSIVGGDTGEDVVSGETVEVGVVVGTEVEKDDRRHPGHPGRLMRLAELAGTCDEIDVGLELTLGHSSNSGNQWANGDRDVKDSSDEEDKWNGGLALGFGVVCQYNHDNNHNK